jgi:hypothetical protein
MEVALVIVAECIVTSGLMKVLAIPVSLYDSGFRLFRRVKL